MLAQIKENYPDQVRHVYRHNPLIGDPEAPFHDKAAISAQAADAAGEQGKFWEMHDLLFERQDEWASLSVDDFKEWVAERALELGLDEEQFTAYLEEEEHAARIQKTWDDNSAIGLTFTPLLLVNEDIWPNNLPYDYSSISAVIELTVMEERQFSECPEMEIDPFKQYVATLHTTKGDIVIELFPEEAPLAVNSFVFLARQSWFDNVMFHRVLPDFVAQAGDPSGTGYGSPGYAFDIETSPDLQFDSAGIVAMANAGPGSNGSQFFITYAPTPQLDGGYTIFGRVIAGMDVAENLAPRDPSQPGYLPPGDFIESVTIQEK